MRSSPPGQILCCWEFSDTQFTERFLRKYKECEGQAVSRLKRWGKTEDLASFTFRVQRRSRSTAMGSEIQMTTHINKDWRIPLNFEREFTGGLLKQNAHRQRQQLITRL